MDPLSQLPVECLQRIIQILDNDNCLFALSSLLTLNKHITSVVLPFLYRDPFRPAFHQWGTSQHSKNRLEMLTRMLLHRLPTACLPKALSAALGYDPAYVPTETTSRSSFDYLSHIRHFNIQSMDAAQLQSSLLTTELCPYELRYIESHEFYRLYETMAYTATYSSNFSSIEDVLEDFYRVVIVLQAFWCLAKPILEQLHSFTIPFTPGIQKYQQVVGRFKNLETIRFAMFEMFDTPFDVMSGKWRVEEVIRVKMEFVQEHIQLFKGQLKTVICLEGNLWRDVGQDYIDRVRLDFYRLLPPLVRPRHLAKDNWLKFSAHPQSVDLAHVWEFNSDRLPESWEDTVCNGQPILQQCRALRRLKVNMYRTGIFKWAAQEKLEKGRRAGTHVDKSHDEQGACVVETLQAPQWIEGLIPLEFVTVAQYAVLSADDVNDIAFAFSQTLRGIKIDEEIRELFDREDPPKPMYVGRGWTDLLALTTLRLTVGVGRLVMDPELLIHCPNLIVLTLQDLTLEYSCQAIVPCLPSRLERLDELSVTGWPALTFNPATLSSTTRLKKLSFGVERRALFGPLYFIPSVEDLQRSYGIESEPGSPPPPELAAAFQTVRPRYTWDWPLPFLTSLQLSSEFAYLFEFKMLQELPALVYLALDIRSTITGNPIRIITDADLRIPASNSDISSTTTQSVASSLTPSSWQQKLFSEDIRVPSLKVLRLHGEWIIDDNAMSTFLATMCPNVKELYFQEWSTTTLESLLKLVRSMPTKYDASVLLDISNPYPSKEDRTRLGIVDYYGGYKIHVDHLHKDRLLDVKFGVSARLLDHLPE
ncbi:hypothetical protein BGZ95_002235 [Linnemannia exigua]|uniref:F-box domain-containing protein n=1 Tax=Linnemannia exigua TaxID=604196 RepID=A0AAD4D5R7_9FUNG|nr:hypothetical protein BGZ95_002235 [Linnemannia exigua]